MIFTGIRSFAFVLCALASSIAAAETGAVIIGSSSPSVSTAVLRGIAVEVLSSRQIELTPDEAVLSVTTGALESEPLPSELEEWATTLESSLVVAVYACCENEGTLTLRATIYRIEEGRAVSGSTTCGVDGVHPCLIEHLETLLDLGQTQHPSVETEQPEHAGDAEEAVEEIGDVEGEQEIIPLSEVPEVEGDTAPPPPLPQQENRRRGRVPFILNSTLLGLSLMTGVLFAADVKDPRLFAPILLVGGASGLAASLLIERRWSISRGDTSIIAVGGWYGAAAGVLVAGAAGFGELRWLVTGGLIGQILGLSAGIISAVFTDVSADDGAVIHSGALWGLGVGGALATLVWHQDQRASYGLILSGLVAGLGLGALVSRFIEVDAGRVAVVDLCGLLGVLLGASVGIPVIFEDQSPGHMRAYAGILLAAAAAGIGLGVVLTRRWDENRERRRPSRRERRRQRRNEGELSFVPVPTVIPPSEAIQGARATLGVQVLGGTW